jgi:hypothetical protein
MLSGPRGVGVGGTKNEDGNQMKEGKSREEKKEIGWCLIPCKFRPEINEQFTWHGLCKFVGPGLLTNLRSINLLAICTGSSRPIGSVQVWFQPSRQHVLTCVYVINDVCCTNPFTSSM